MNKDKNQIQRLKDMIDDDIEYKKIHHILLNADHIPAENMRILHSLCNSGCDREFIGLLCLSEFSYEDIKQIKYLVKCAKCFDYDPNIFKDAYRMNANLLTEYLMKKICKDNWFSNLYQEGCDEIIEKCLLYKMEPEFIKFMTDPTYRFNAEKMKVVAVGFLQGLSIEDVKNTIKDDAINIDVNILRENIKEKINEKNFSIYSLDEEIVNELLMYASLDTLMYYGTETLSYEFNNKCKEEFWKRAYEIENKIELKNKQNLDKKLILSLKKKGDKK